MNRRIAPWILIPIVGVFLISYPMSVEARNLEKAPKLADLITEPEVPNRIETIGTGLVGTHVTSPDAAALRSATAIRNENWLLRVLRIIRRLNLGGIAR